MADRERLQLMLDSGEVKLIDLAVIATTMSELDDRRGEGEVIDYLDAAKAIIAAQTEAGLGTFVLADLNTFIAEVKAWPASG